MRSKGPNYSHPEHQKCEILDICVPENSRFSGAFLSSCYFYVIFTFLELSFKILKILPLPSALSLSYDAIDTSGKIQWLVPFCAWVRYMLRVKPNSVLPNCPAVCSFLPGPKNHQSTLIKFNIRVCSFSVWKWYLEEITLKFVIVNIHSPCPNVFTWLRKTNTASTLAIKLL